MLEQDYYIFLLVVMILMMLMPNRERTKVDRHPLCTGMRQENILPKKRRGGALFDKETWILSYCLYKKQTPPINIAMSTGLVVKLGA